MKSIQKCIFPSLDICSEETLYFRLKGNGIVSYSQKKIFLERSSKIAFDTYYNGLSLSIIKKHTVIEDLFLNVAIRGEALIKIGIHRFGKPLRWLLEDEIKDETKTFTLKKELLSAFKEGLLFFEVYALSDIEFNGYEWQTDMVPAESVKLAVVITHFNRLNYVLPAIERLNKEILNDQIKLFVIDNSKNINIPKHEHLAFIKN